MCTYTVTLTPRQYEILQSALLAQSNSMFQGATDATKNGKSELAERLTLSAQEMHELSIALTGFAVD